MHPNVHYTTPVNRKSKREVRQELLVSKNRRSDPSKSPHQAPAGQRFQYFSLHGRSLTESGVGWNYHVDRHSIRINEPCKKGLQRRSFIGVVLHAYSAHKWRRYLLNCRTALDRTVPTITVFRYSGTLSGTNSSLYKKLQFQFSYFLSGYISIIESSLLFCLEAFLTRTHPT